MPILGLDHLAIVVAERAAPRRLYVDGFRPIEWPLPRGGAVGPILPLHFRDPDGNLVALARPG
jgi:hypothetical protein